MNSIKVLINFFVSHQEEIVEQTIEHIGLTVVALSIAVCIGLPLGILLTRFKRLATSVLGFTGVIQTIPSIALLGFLLPLLGIGVVAARAFAREIRITVDVGFIITEITHRYDGVQKQTLDPRHLDVLAY